MPINILEDNHQGKLVSDTTTFWFNKIRCAQPGPNFSRLVSAIFGWSGEDGQNTNSSEWHINSIYPPAPFGKTCSI